MKKIIIIILIIFSGLNLCIKARAETASELRAQIEDTNKQIELANNDSKSNSRMMLTLRKNKMFPITEKLDKDNLNKTIKRMVIKDFFELSTL